jgi:hypothetical protein
MLRISVAAARSEKPTCVYKPKRDKEVDGVTVSRNGEVKIARQGLAKEEEGHPGHEGICANKNYTSY